MGVCGLSPESFGEPPAHAWEVCHVLHVAFGIDDVPWFCGRVYRVRSCSSRLRTGDEPLSVS